MGRPTCRTVRIKAFRILVLVLIPTGEYRSDIAPNGIFVSMGSNPGLGFAMDDALLNMSMETPNNFGDAELLIGKTYSDYGSDIHITPISNGGTSPMDYIDIVINMGTVSSEVCERKIYTGYQ